MARKRGFFAELQRASAQAQRENERAKNAAYQAQLRAHREAEKYARDVERWNTQMSRMDAKERAAAEKEQKRLHVESQEAEVAMQNEDLVVLLADIDNVLVATVSVDDYVDLEGLRQHPNHPAFASEHEPPIPKPEPLAAPPEPTFTAPPAPTGVSGLFGKKKHQEAVAKAEAEFAPVHAAWQAEVAALPIKQMEQLAAHQQQEATRAERLAQDRATYDANCAAAEAELATRNDQLDELISGLAAGRAAAVEEYIGIVLGDSIYPDVVSPSYDYHYDAAGKELTIHVDLPAPTQLPTVASYKYTKASDTISERSQTQKQQKDRYNDFVANTALRTIHEIFEADRLGNIDSISLTAGVSTISPATGQPDIVTLVACAVSRDTFMAIDLANVIAAVTLRHFNATLSRNPHGLVGIESGRGVRAH